MAQKIEDLQPTPRTASRRTSAGDPSRGSLQKLETPGNDRTEEMEKVIDDADDYSSTSGRDGHGQQRHGDRQGRRDRRRWIDKENGQWRLLSLVDKAAPTAAFGPRVV